MADLDRDFVALGASNGGGGGVVVNGNYRTIQGIRSRAMRLLRIRRRREYGSTTEIGSRLYLLQQAVDDAAGESRQTAKDYILEAWAPLLESGEMTDLEIVDSREVPSRPGFVFLEGSYTDATTGQSETIPVTPPWEA